MTLNSEITDKPVALGFQIELEFGNVGFLRRGENRRTRRKTSRSKDENQQQTQPTFGAEFDSSGNRTRATLVGGLRGRQMLNHCAIPAPPTQHQRQFNGFVQ